jgi:hypothetical protein
VCYFCFYIKNSSNTEIVCNYINLPLKLDFIEDIKIKAVVASCILFKIKAILNKINVFA